MYLRCTRCRMPTLVHRLAESSMAITQSFGLSVYCLDVVLQLAMEGRLRKDFERDRISVAVHVRSVASGHARQIAFCGRFCSMISSLPGSDVPSLQY